jgi:hypothetical protein
MYWYVFLARSNDSRDFQIFSCTAPTRMLTTGLSDFSFNSISKEFFFATTSGLLLWLGFVSFQFLLCFFFVFWPFQNVDNIRLQHLFEEHKHFRLSAFV